MLPLSRARSKPSPRQDLLAQARRTKPRRVLVFACLFFVGFLIWSHAPGGSVSGLASTGTETWLDEQVDGSVRVSIRPGAGKNEHPIRILMREAKDKWHAQLARQSRTYDQAVEAYKLRYGRSPPKGFDAWWKFAKAKRVKIVDDYDKIHTSITPFLALDPPTMAARLKHYLEKEPFVYIIESRRSKPITTTGERGENPRAMFMRAFQEGFRRWLPSDFGEGAGHLGELGGDDGLVRLSVTDQDLGRTALGQQFRARLMELASKGKTIDEDELRDFENIDRESAISSDLYNACSDQSPAGDLVAHRADARTTVGNDSVSFIRDNLKSFDFCLNPSLTSLHGIYSAPHARESKLIPQLALSASIQGSEIVVPQAGHLDAAPKRVSWKKRTINKIFWRGSTTGDYHHARPNYDWRNSHRIRLHTTAHRRVGAEHVLVEQATNQPLMSKKYGIIELNKHLMDIGLSEVVQCSEEDGTCAAMRREIKLAPFVSTEEAVKYKYAFDIDGNGWSSRFRRLLDPGYVVFKTTLFPDWNSEWITPWLHYIPVKLDFSDLYHSATFFLGTPDGMHPGHDELAREMSEAAKRFVDENWREVDMQSYWFRMLLEYRRAMAWDRDAMSLGGKMML